MSVRIKYAYLHGQVWMFRRNYPEDVSLILGKKALKRSLKTSDPKVARSRATELSKVYNEQVATARASYPKLVGVSQSAPEVPGSAPEWGQASREVIAQLRATLGQGGGIDFEAGGSRHRPTIASLGRTYLRKRSAELRHGGFKSVRYSVELFVSKYGGVPVTELGREHGREFLELISQLSRVIGKSEKTQGLGLDELVAFSRGRKDWITARTQKRIWWQVKHFLDWVVYEGELEQNPFKSVRFDRRVTPAPYAVMTDAEVTALLSAKDPDLHAVLLFCLLTGMRSGEATGLLRDDLVRKENLGWFVRVRPNAVRDLKTDASEREVPLHSVLEDLLPSLPSVGRLFPELSVNVVTKRFTALRERLQLSRPGLVFHSTRKWFITQCERTGVPEHFTASLVGHKSARSENQLTYGIYSAGISDHQKRGIVDQLRLPS